MRRRNFLSVLGGAAALLATDLKALGFSKQELAQALRPVASPTRMRFLRFRIKPLALPVTSGALALTASLVVTQRMRLQSAPCLVN
jgi:hypothetical protein